MKLINQSTMDEVALSNSFLWTDELAWTPVIAAATYTLTGALVIEQGLMQAGRPITIEPPDESMAWMKRSDVLILQGWAAEPTLQMKLVLEYPDDTREFTVVFRHQDGALDAKPVKGFGGHDPDEWFNVTIRLIEVA